MIKAWIFDNKPFNRRTVRKNKLGKDLLQVDPTKLRNGKYFISDKFYQENKRLIDVNTGTLVRIRDDAFFKYDSKSKILNFDSESIIII